MRIIVVDNESKDGSPDMVEQEYPDLQNNSERTEPGLCKGK